MRHRPLEAGEAGVNRFDSPYGQYRVIYCGSSAEVCYGETLAPLRPSDHLAALVAPDWDSDHMNVMKPGQIPRDWRERRSILRATLDSPLPFVDIDHPKTHQWLGQDRALALSLAVMGIDAIDIGAVATADRRVTQIISNTIWNAKDDDDRHLYSGIRYLSRVNPAWECWAVFDDVDWIWQSPEPILPNNADLQRVTDLFGLTVH
jgi:hypothetical protein